MRPHSTYYVLTTYHPPYYIGGARAARAWSPAGQDMASAVTHLCGARVPSNRDEKRREGERHLPNPPVTATPAAAHVNDCARGLHLHIRPHTCGCTNDLCLASMSSTDENALVACDVAVETAEARAAEAEGLAQRYLLERDELLQRVEAEAEARRGREEV